MDWSKLEFVDYQINQKTGKKYYQQYLKPSYYLEVYLRWTNATELLGFYEAVLNELGSSFHYHGSNKKSAVTKIRKRTAALDFFIQFLKSKQTYCWNYLSNAGGVGNANVQGGIGDASLDCWIHKTPFSVENKRSQVEKYKENLTTYGTEMLPIGTRISKIRLCFPLGFFATPHDFLSWILNSKLIKEGSFFSGSAGYGINSWEGYVNKEAQKKLQEILINYPGLGWNISTGNSLGRFLNSTKSDFLPVIKRLNWLTLVSKEGVSYLGGFEALKQKIAKSGVSTVHLLEKGIGIQTSNKPALSITDEGFNQYFELSRILNVLSYKNHPKDHYFTPNNETAKEWLYRFNS